MAKAKRYLDDIIAHRQSIVFRRYCAYMSSPCHSELFLLEKEDPMKKEVRKRVKRSESRWGR
ncbi:60S ribosomal protein L17-2 [Zea mays]|uniref:60S ribosomal protein L17-2 n=1 Tax=Zea mays TaxID=4577 RepID=A0A1D6M2R7_MAIZE|nr:60S ribosomal protein L17-2 [Zea mays]